MFKVVIIGGEERADYEFFQYKCAFFLKEKAKAGSIMIYSTGNRLVDQFASKYGITVQTFNTDWRKWGKNALKARNEEMLSDCDAVIIFNDKLKDTLMIKKMAAEKGLPIRIITLP